MNQVDPLAMALDAVLGQLAYGSCADGVAEFFLFELPDHLSRLCSWRVLMVSKASEPFVKGFENILF